MLAKISATFSKANASVLVRDFFTDAPVRIYHENGALMDPLGLTTTDSTGKAEAWYRRGSTFPEMLLLSGGGDISSEVTPPGGAAVAEGATLGEIRYFFTPPSDPNWLPCDGAARLRADYPALADLRPDPALRAEELTYGDLGTPIATFSDIFRTPSGAQIYLAYNATTNAPEIWRTLDVLTSVGVMATGLTGIQSLRIAEVAGGELIGIDFYTSTCYVSVDDGVTWSSEYTFTTAATAVTLSTLRVAEMVDTSGHLYVPFPGTHQMLTWKTSTPGGFSVVATAELVPNILGGYSTGDGVMYYYGGQNTLAQLSDGYFYANGSPARIDAIADSRNISGNQYEIYRASGAIAKTAGPAALISWGTEVLAEFSNTPVSLVNLAGYPVVWASEVPSPADSKMILLARVLPDGSVEEVATPPTLTRMIFQQFALLQFGYRPIELATEVFLMTVEVTEQSAGVVRLFLDPLRFNIPKLPSKSGALPYVYTGS